MRIGAELNQMMNALDRQVQIAKNTAGLAVFNDKKERAADEVTDAEGVSEAAEASGDNDTPLGNNVDVEA